MNRNNKVSLLTKIFAWSLIFESLLFFVIADQLYTGIVISIGRIFQFFVLIILIFALLMRKTPIRFPNLLNTNYRYFFFYFLLSVIAMLIGLWNNSYALDSSYNINFANNSFAQFFRGSNSRPFIEYLIIIYYFLYFVIFSNFLIRTPASLSYFFRSFKLAFTVCLILGFADLIFQMAGIYFLPRDMWEGRIVGFRFHGLAGEPRDAFVYLFYAWGIMNLKTYWEKKGTLSFSWILVLLAAALLTQSASGLIGILIGIGLCIYLLKLKIFYKKIIKIAFPIIAGIGIIFFTILSSQRLKAYWDILLVIFQSLEFGESIPEWFIPQMVNIFPIWDMYLNLRDFNIIPVFFGNGFGSSSVINNNLGKEFWNELTNPHSQIIRILYESGFIGLVVYIKSFIYPIEKFTCNLPKSIKLNFLIISLIIIGVNLGHRSTTLFIYLGILISLFTIKEQNKGWIKS